MVGGARDDSIRPRKGFFSIGIKVTHHEKEPAEPITGINSIFLAIRCCRVICQGLAHSAFFFFRFSFSFCLFWAPERWQIQNDQGRRGKDAILQRSKPPRSFSIPFTRSVRACFFLSSSLISASSLARSSFEIGALAVASSASSS